ncbi:hypothetical protein [Nostoc punctiforme]|uniref:PRC-barrel domain-containing protein n=1 Tax=Nostoc punctiforme (strain ATCC 29133 / PCC 73102) TaxID=63737 RepID=B2JC16_NOSP7|nr:hypothetical protein [Nostoc punctiforme]ACC85470.1 hypothetical protein Npun_ER002 [Nostoc punctiforme PCC 73102]
MNIIRDVLDNQLVDSDQHKLGKVDGIVIELRDGEPPRLSYIETGMTTLARRIHPRLGRWVAAIQSSWGAKRGKVTEAVTRGKVACKYYQTSVSAFIMIGDSDHSPLLKSSDKKWSRN